MRKYKVQLCQMFHYVVHLPLKCNNRVICFATHCFFWEICIIVLVLAVWQDATVHCSDIAELCHLFFSSLEKSSNNIITIFHCPFFISTRFLSYLKRSFQKCSNERESESENVQLRERESDKSCPLLLSLSSNQTLRTLDYFF